MSTSDGYSAGSRHIPPGQEGAAKRRAKGRCGSSPYAGAVPDLDGVFSDNTDVAVAARTEIFDN
jgi:hypothetical protein